VAGNLQAFHCRAVREEETSFRGVVVLLGTCSFFFFVVAGLLILYAFNLRLLQQHLLALLERLETRT